MKAVILAAGKGSRMWPLGETTPKLLIPIFNRPLIHNFVDILDGFVDEIIFVIDDSIFGNKIKDYASHIKFPVKISFALQDESKGTAYAFQCAKDFIPISEKFIGLYGDDIYFREDINGLVKYQYAAMAKKMPDPEKWGIFKIDEEQNLIELVEKPKESIGNLANIGMFMLDSKIFDYFEKIKPSIRGEYEFTDTLTEFAKDEKVKVLACTDWIPVGYPWHILDAHERMKYRFDNFNEGTIEDGVHIHGNLKLGKDSVIKSGAYLEGDIIIGDNCIIGPNVYLRGVSVIGDNCKIGNAVEIKNSTIFSDTKIEHLSYIGDSIIGSNVRVGAGTITANRRYDKENVKTMIKGNLVNIGRRKFGTVIGDNSCTSINTSIYPGRKLGSDLTTLPGEIIKVDKIN